MTKTFGRANDNTDIISKPDISSHHAKITFLGNDSFFIEDVNSLNGVFVNGYRIQKAKISGGDEVRLSEDTILDLPSIFDQQPQKKITPVVKSDPKDFTREFLLLKDVWDEYHKVKAEINKKFQRKSTIIRSLLSVAPLAIYTIFQITYLNKLEHTDPDAYKKWQGSFIYFSGIGGAIGNLVGGLMIPSPQEKLNILEDEFRVMYICPNPDCRTQLGNISWKVYKRQGKCFRCQARYSNGDEG
jgi:hypothetical protein